MVILRLVKSPALRTTSVNGALRSILAAHENTRADGANLFAVRTALGYGKDFPGPAGHGILATNDREGSVEHEPANGEMMAMFAIRGSGGVGLRFDLRVAIGLQ